MKKTVVAVTLALAVCVFLYSEEVPENGRLSIFGETCVIASGGGFSYCGKMRNASGVEIAASYLRSGGFEAETAYAFHVSQLFKTGRKKAGGLFLGYGASYVTIGSGEGSGVFAAHFRVKLELPLGERSGIHIGAYPLMATIYAPFILPIPNIQAGFYMNL
jgi:hypothetical protein